MPTPCWTLTSIPLTRWMLDFDQHPSDEVVEHLKQVEGVLRVRVIK